MELVRKFPSSVPLLFFLLLFPFSHLSFSCLFSGALSLNPARGFGSAVSLSQVSTTVDFLSFQAQKMHSEAIRKVMKLRSWIVPALPPCRRRNAGSEVCVVYRSQCSFFGTKCSLCYWWRSVTARGSDGSIVFNSVGKFFSRLTR